MIDEFSFLTTTQPQVDAILTLVIACGWREVAKWTWLGSGA
jgi:hypothetical protein